MSYSEFLKKNIFKTDEFYSFNLLFKNLKQINRLNFKHIAILERSHIYFGKSIFSPLIHSQIKSLIDYNFYKKPDSRNGYQTKWLDKINFKFDHSEYLITDHIGEFDFDFKSIDCECLIIPNVLHHCSNFDKLVSYFSKKFPKLKYIYIFDSYLRENHQHPYDFARHNLSSLECILKKHSYNIYKQEETGNAFDAMLYIFSQSKKILGKSENIEIKNKINKLIPLLNKKKHYIKWRKLGRKYATLTTAYSVTFINNKTAN